MMERMKFSVILWAVLMISFMFWITYGAEIMHWFWNVLAGSIDSQVQFILN